jgi:hypothetical protein
MADNPVLNSPGFLHIPALNEGSTADIFWEKVPGAEQYELECVFDGDFSNAESGGTWGDLHDQDKPRSETDGTFSWQELAEETAKGVSWHVLLSGNPSWSDCESAEVDWVGLHKTPTRHTVYLGTAENSGETVSWDDLNSLSMNWADTHEELAPWPTLPKNTGEYHYTLKIPQGRKTAKFRVRAYALDGRISDYITSAEIFILSPFRRNDSIRLSVVKGEEYLLQLHARNIERASDIISGLDYSPYYLQLLEELPNLSYGIILESSGNISPGRIFREEGRIRFRWPEEANGTEDLVKPFLTLRAKALQTGMTEIKIY